MGKIQVSPIRPCDSPTLRPGSLELSINDYGLQHRFYIYDKHTKKSKKAIGGGTRPS